jgi:hypothetical protein
MVAKCINFAERKLTWQNSFVRAEHPKLKCSVKRTTRCLLVFYFCRSLQKFFPILRAFVANTHPREGGQNATTRR